jgi:endonuclease/exonuclease/phosphatase family metal-dependent hydrolase
LKRYLRKILIWTNVALALMLFIAYAANYVNPQYFWPFAFFGLAYPFLLIFNILFCLLWIWRRRWFALISLFAIVSGFSNIGRYVQFRLPGKQPVENNYLKLLSYNVRLFNYYQWQSGGDLRRQILQFVRSETPDIITFQDFVSINSNDKQSETYTDSLLHNYPWKHVLYTYHSKSSFSYGVATYSRFPIIKRGNIPFPDSYNSCIYSDIVVGSDTIRVYNVHLQSIKFRKNYYYFADSLAAHPNAKRFVEARDISDHLKVAFIKRAQQVDELEQHIRRSPYRVVICGDFNDTPVSYTYQQIRGNRQDAFMRSGSGFGNTYRGNIPSFRIDYIFHSKEITSFQYKTHKIDYSDHYPVSCELVLGE